MWGERVRVIYFVCGGYECVGGVHCVCRGILWGGGMCRDGCVGALCNMSHKDNPMAIGGMNSHSRVVYAGGWRLCLYGGAVVSGCQRTTLCSQPSLLLFCGV